jgi:hypothetical protein
MAPHHFGKLDLNPLQRRKLDQDPHQNEKQDPDPHQSEKVLRVILELWRAKIWKK